LYVSLPTLHVLTAQIIGAPSFFPTVWSWIKRWFDPVTVSKIFILSQSEVLPTLEKFIPIENVPKLYGGKLDFNWGDLPVLEPALADTLDWLGDSTKPESRSILTGPLKWLPSSISGRMDLVLVGTKNGKPNKRVVARTKLEIDITLMSGFPTPTSPAKSQPVDWRKEDLARLTAREAQEPVENAEHELEKEGIDMDNVGNYEAKPQVAMVQS
jgi:hypothetical protein